MPDLSRQWHGVFRASASNKMIPVLHRAQEKQAPIGIGVEIDVWMTTGLIAVVSHDSPTDASKLLVNWLRDDVRVAGFRPLYAVNCKSDGLEESLRNAFDKFGVPRDRWFVFDCSYPSQRVFERAGLPFAERVSEEEPWRGHSHRIWLDRWTWRDNGAAFTGPGLGIRRYPVPADAGVYLPYSMPAKRPGIFDGRKIEVHAVSMELHVTDTAEHERRNWWRWLFDEVKPMSVCTDYPEDLMQIWDEWQRG